MTTFSSPTRPAGSTLDSATAASDQAMRPQVAATCHGMSPFKPSEYRAQKRESYRYADWHHEYSGPLAFGTTKRQNQIFTHIAGYASVMEHNARIAYCEKMAAKGKKIDDSAFKNKDYLYHTSEGMQAIILNKFFKSFLLNRRRYSQIPLARGHRDQMLQELLRQLEGSLSHTGVDLKTSQARNRSISKPGDNPWAASQKLQEIFSKDKEENAQDFEREFWEASRAEHDTTF